MPADEDIALDEKRVHGERRGATRAVVASGLGLATVDVSDDQIGRFGLAHRCVARDVAGDGRLAVATDDYVLVGNVEILESTDFGPAVAVGFEGAENGRCLLAAGPDGRVARQTDDGWTEVGTLDTAVRAIDGDLLAAADGVYAVGDDLSSLGLDDVRDVAASGSDAGGERYAATADGLARFDGSEWTVEREGDATVVASDGERVHAVVDGVLLERRDGDEGAGSRSGDERTVDRAGDERTVDRSEDERDDGESAWADADCPADGVVGVAYAESVYAVTGDGTFLVDPASAKDGAVGWRSRELGLGDVVALAVP